MNLVGIINDPKLTNAAFWQKQVVDGDQVILQSQEIKQFNQLMIKSTPALYDLTQYPMEQDATKICEKIHTNNDILTDSLYQNGIQISQSYKNFLINKCNIAVLKGWQRMQYGVTVRRCNLRIMPTNQALFSTVENTAFDVLQETAIDPSEPILLLHKSTENDFYFVQTYYCYGWVSARDIALINERIVWLRYSKPDWFFVVIDQKFRLGIQGEKLLYQMGSKILIKSISNDQVKVIVPIRNINGYLEEKVACITALTGLHNGYLPYTRSNIIEQSFKFLGEPYGWGGLQNSVDCSSLVNNVYRTMGIDLPRNSGQQERTAGIHYTMHGLTMKDRCQLIAELQPGDTLHMNGHVMLYLGQVSQIPYVIHALGSYTEHFSDGSCKKIPIMQVVVSDLTLKRYNGITFIDDLTTAVSFRFLI